MNFRTYLTHRNIYLFSIIFLAVSLPLSIYTTSIAEIILVANWLIERNFRQKLQILKKRKSLWFIMLLYLLHIAGLIYTSNFSYALHDLRIKLPLLLLPLVIGTSHPLNARQVKITLLFFTAAVAASSLISVMIFFGLIPYEYYDIREISIFISHIRLALMVNLSIFILVFYHFISNAGLRFSKTGKFISIIVMAYLILFLFLLKSLTGIIIFTVVTLILLWISSGKIGKAAPRYLLRLFIIVIPLIIFSWIMNGVNRYYDREEIDFSELDEYTAKGSPYFHDTLRQATENGYYVWINVNEQELRKCWNAVSNFKYSGLDKKKQEIKYTLIRYLTSRGLRKDCEGIQQLTQADVKAIENGIANHIFLDKYSLYPRLYETIWEIDGYLRGGDPSGHSVAQRIAYLKAARKIISSHIWFGTGTGDVQKEFNEYYESINSKLDIENRRRAHNQFVTFFITFGLTGFVISMFSLFAPVFYERRWHDYLFLVFFIIALLSMLNEDTLETQTGVSFFIFFYSFLLFGRKDKKSSEYANKISQASN